MKHLLTKTLAILLAVTVITALGMSALAEAQTVSATATGMGTVKVELTVEDGQITAAVVDTSNETAGYGLEIADALAQQILSVQSAEIDGISGSTITSAAVRTATAQALAAAGVAAERRQMTPGVYVGVARGWRAQ